MPKPFNPIRFTVWAVLTWALFSGCAARKGLSGPPEPARRQDKARAYGIFIRAKAYQDRNNPFAAEYGYKKVVELDSTALYVRVLLAKSLMARGENREALGHIEYAARRDTTFDHFFLFGTLLYKNDRLSEAATAFRTALRFEPESVRAREILASLYERLGRNREAMAVYRALMESKSETWYREKLIALYIKEKQPARALAALRGLLLEYPGSAGGRLSLLALADLMDPPDSLAALYRELIAAHPENTDLVKDFASLLVKIDKLEAARQTYAALCEKEPTFANRKVYGILLSYMNRHAEAESLLTPVMAQKPDADVAFYLGGALLGQDKFPDAAALYGQCIGLDSGFTSGWINRGIAFLRADMHDSAEAALAGAARRFPDEASPDYLLGILFRKQERWAEAIVKLKAALAKNPDNVEMLFDLASAYERAGDFQRSEKVFRRILVMDSLHDRSLNYLGYMYAERGVNLDTARHYIRRALNIDPDNGAHLDSYGWVLFKLKQYKEAETYIARAIKHHEADPVIFEHMAIIRETLGDPAGARPFWEKVLELDPKNEKAQKAFHEEPKTPSGR
jgi:tetratricopeptide (TPR) repeat protein